MKKISLTVLTVFILTIFVFNSCKDDDDDKQTNETVCLLTSYMTMGDTLIQTYTYDADKRPIKMQYYSNAQPTNYAVYEYTSTAYRYASFSSNNELQYAYENPLPFNSQGLCTYSRFMLHNQSSTQYDSIFYEYNSAKYKTKEIRWTKYVDNSGATTYSQNTTNYTYTGNNLTKSEYYSGTDAVYTLEYEYYLDKPNKAYNLSPYLGKTSANLVKKVIFTNPSNTNNYIIEYEYTLDSDGKVMQRKQTTTYTQQNPPHISVYERKFVYDCK